MFGMLPPVRSVSNASLASALPNIRWKTKMPYEKMSKLYTGGAKFTPGACPSMPARTSHGNQSYLRFFSSVSPRRLKAWTAWLVFHCCPSSAEIITPRSSTFRRGAAGARSARCMLQPLKSRCNRSKVSRYSSACAACSSSIRLSGGFRGGSRSLPRGGGRFSRSMRAFRPSPRTSSITTYGCVGSSGPSRSQSNSGTSYFRRFASKSVGASFA
mmetsp:Transcript_47039/g.142827  ORF Transcript_47039/g.142827 Transcript_47039/m.142827 type:complete len:214 (+) Transcript_47039:100-741(+)